MCKDPIGLAGNNPNLYAYTDDSNTAVDPLGLFEGFLALYLNSMLKYLTVRKNYQQLQKHLLLQHQYFPIIMMVLHINLP